MKDKTKINASLFLLDMDGTLYLSDEVIDGAIEAIDRLRKRAKITFLTNNSSKSKSAYLEKLRRLGFSASDEEILTSGMCAAEHLSTHHAGRRVLCVGTDALCKELSGWGVSLVDTNPDIVLLGYDTELTYEKLAKAAVAIRNGATYYTTHRDINCPAKGGYVPDAGAFIEMFKASTGRLPEAEFGKPSKMLADMVQRRSKLAADQIAMVGDRIYTDIVFAKKNGFTGVLVLSGESKRTDITLQGMPDYVVKSIAFLE